MSDAPTPKRGIRTFASDFSRLKNNQTDQTTEKNHSPAPAKVIATPKRSTPPPEPIKKQVVHTPTQEPTITPAKIETINTIPAFHELEKAVKNARNDASDKPAPKKQKLFRRKRRSIEAHRKVGGGTVIRDTKTSSNKKRSGIFSGLSQWFASLGRKKKSAPTLAIPETSRRKGVIQQATTKTGTIFTADAESLKERIRERKLRTEFADHNSEIETTWSPYTDTGYPLLESGRDTTQNTSIQFSQHTTPQTLSAEPEVPAPVEPVAPLKPIADNVEQAPTVPEPVTPPPVVESTYLDPVIESYDQDVVSPEPLEPTDNRWEETVVEPEIEPTIDEQPAVPETQPTPIVEPAVKPQRSGRFTTNQLTLYSVGALVSVLIVVAASWSVYTYILNRNTLPDVTLPPSQLTDAVEVPIAVDRSFTAQSLINIARSGEFTHTEFVLQNTNKEPLTPTEALGFVTPAVPTVLQQYMTDIRFVSISRDRPQVLITFSDKISMTGALFTSEETLGSAFAPLFGSVNGEFVDRRIGGVDVRVLANSNRDIVLIYGFLDDQTLLISGSIEEFMSVQQFKQ